MVVIELARYCMLSELLYDDDLILRSGTIDVFRSEFIKWKAAFWSKGLKVNLGKPCDGQWLHDKGWLI